MRTFQEQLIDIRRAIHRYPELGENEVRTTALIEKELKAAGIRTKRITRTGVIGLVTGTRRASGRARTFALRGDIDALPIQEKTGKPYASRVPGVMHACGHDANATMVLGAALLLARQRDTFAGNVKFIFQPNEESSGGAQALVDAGVLRDPAVDAIVGIHVSPWLASRPAVKRLD
jgi:amidohydrolase